MNFKINVQVDATPDIIKEHLLAHADNNPLTNAQPFPFEEGDFIHFSPEMAQALAVDASSPVLVRQATLGSPTAIILFFNSAGQIQEHPFQLNQLSYPSPELEDEMPVPDTIPEIQEENDPEQENI